jgi:hypothetical protein
MSGLSWSNYSGSPYNQSLLTFVNLCRDCIVDDLRDDVYEKLVIFKKINRHYEKMLGTGFKSKASK